MRRLRALSETIRSSIAAKILLSLLAVFVLLAVVYIVGADRQSARTLKAAAEREMDQSAGAAAQSVSGWFETRTALIETSAESVSRVAPGPLVTDALKRSALRRRFLVTYFGGVDGTFAYDHFRRPLPADFDARTRPWYRAAVARGATVLTDPYLDVTIGERVVTLATPSRRRGALLGVTAGDFSIGGMEGMLRSVVSGHSRYAFLMSGDGRIIIHPDHSMLGRTVSSLLSQPRRGLTGTRRFAEGGIAKVVRFRRVPNLPGNNWYVGIVWSEADAASRSGEPRAVLIFGVIFLVALGAFVVALLLSRLLLVPVRALAATMHGIAQGDYGRQVDLLERGDEIGDMARAVEVFRNNGLLVNQLVEREAQQLRDASRNRAQTLARLRESFGTVLASASAGDFCVRIDAGLEDPELVELAASINEMLDLVDRGLAATGAMLGALARADLSQRHRGAFKGDLARLQDDANAVADNLSGLVLRLLTASRHIHDSTSLLAEGAGRLTARTARQRTSLITATSVLTRLARTVEGNAADVGQASDRAQEARRSAEQGVEAIAQATDAIDRMRASSQAISQVTALIQDIARRTALVGLNATIEAARSSQQGAGFSVVANEMKSLAEQAAAASQEVATLVARASADVITGTDRIGVIAEELTKVLVAVKTGGDRLVAVAVACREQAAAVEEIRGEVSAISLETGANAELAIEIQDRLIGAGELAATLEAVVTTFRVTDESRAPSVINAQVEQVPGQMRLRCA